MKKNSLLVILSFVAVIFSTLHLEVLEQFGTNKQTGRLEKHRFTALFLFVPRYVERSTFAHHQPPFQKDLNDEGGSYWGEKSLLDVVIHIFKRDFYSIYWPTFQVTPWKDRVFYEEADILPEPTPIPQPDDNVRI